MECNLEEDGRGAFETAYVPVAVKLPFDGDSQW